MSFHNDLKKFRRKTMQKYVDVKRMSAFDLFSAIVLDTPVDKGVLRNNWFAAINNRALTETTDGSKHGRNTITRINAILQSTDEKNDIFLSNNLPYATPIEFDGHSGKAPEGMVRVNTIRWDAIVRRNARKVRRAV